MNEEVIATELRVLGALCQQNGAEATRASARTTLAGYPWREPVHQALFEIVMRFPSAGSQHLREQLPALLTRRGFPDFDFDGLFTMPAAAQTEIEQWIAQLKQSS